jgi:hypothetical protein
MRNVLFVLEPLGTGKAWRELAIAEQLRRLFPAISPHFLANPAAAELLRASGEFPVDDTLEPILPDAASVARRDTGQLAARAPPRAAASRPPTREAVRAARALRAGSSSSTALLGAAALKRAGFDVAFVTDHLRDAEVDGGGSARRRGAAATRRRLTSSLRFFVGEPSYLASPELRVWSRRFFRYTGPISALARLNLRECATLRDDLGLGRKKLLVVAGGSAFAAPSLTAALEGAQALAAERGDVVVRAFLGPELAVEVGEARGTTLSPPLHELPRHLAIADACVVGGGVSLLSECAGLRVPTLACRSRAIR